MESIKDEWALSPLNPSVATSRLNPLAVLRKGLRTFIRLLAALGVFVVAWSLFDPHLPTLTFFDLRALLLATILIAAGIADLVNGIVPIEITYPLMLASIVRAIITGDPSFLLYWFALAIIYLFNVIGGGDVKLLMGMFGLWPHMEFFIVMEIVVIVTHLPIVLYRRFRDAEARAQVRAACIWLWLKVLDAMLGETPPQNLIRATIAQRPSGEKLSQHGDRLAITFGLAGIVYLLLMTPVGMNWNVRI